MLLAVRILIASDLFKGSLEAGQEAAAPPPTAARGCSRRSVCGCSTTTGPSWPPAEVAGRARAAGVPCVVLAGVVRLSSGELAAAGFAGAHALTEVEPDLAGYLASP